eukprot:CAMPEP_0116999404 /NCGR_PEP_ID=MMETSP0472-20121206/2117_1 /TAXON_ID=693140 ORGANISM="Tiarina fusus, Strain LIS" /NCGR_SAMPLE_ID=MMETSP0472 /ASSEMBLY_ACC=CAM_ASM_000603 /LENGTH=243 /DNA_ID=CAMNT_0004698805 /DNA_START=220 /DNA_END=951 /DNA_ORIENTATION=-
MEYKSALATITSIFMKNMQLGIKLFRENFPQQEDEIRAYSLLQKPDSDVRLHELNSSELSERCWLYLQPLPTKENREITVQVKKYQREDPEIKSLEWMRIKTELEKSLPPNFEETLLAGGDNYNELYEGLSSNFFAVKEKSVFVAPEGTILLGTMMRLVLEACDSLGFRVVREVPKVTEVSEWSGCFISGTSRLVLPINRITFPDHDGIQEKVFTEKCSVVVAIRKFVSDKLEERSVVILPDK